MARLHGVVLLVRDVGRSLAFYGPQGLGLQLVEAATAGAAQLELPPLRLTLLAAQPGCEAPLATGYSPLLSLQLDDVAARLPRLLQLGAHMDGPLRYAPRHAAATIRTPDGHMLALFSREGEEALGEGVGVGVGSSAG